MKSRRELLAGLLVDMAKAVFVSIVIGKFLTPDFVTWFVCIGGIFASAVATWCAYLVHPEHVVDKGWKLWK
ncbi:MAG: hypothetical protein OXU45_08980 [Candidatus Melainabacteria bacterium]|nr:hypothetical protein [Candidatus Melainabacteria bacterium]